MSLTVSVLNRQTLRTVETLLVVAGGALASYVTKRRDDPRSVDG